MEIFARKCSWNWKNKYDNRLTRGVVNQVGDLVSDPVGDGEIGS